MSAHQLHRTLDVPYKTAWFMAHRIREGMRPDSPDGLGGEGKTVEADETYFGKAENPNPRNKYLPPPTKRGKTGPAASARSWRWSSAAGTSAASTSSAPTPRP
jgi:hypothetical protein